MLAEDLVRYTSRNASQLSHVRDERRVRFETGEGFVAP